MFKSSSHLRLITAAGVLCGLLLMATAPVSAQKLYRWTDKDGKVHYSDQVPPDAVDNARDELNKQGISVKKVERALTPEERAAQDAEEERLARDAELAAEKAERAEMLINSYPDEAALERSYTERFDLLDQSIESARLGVASQSKSLNDLLEHAAAQERAGKTVPKAINQSITLARQQLQEQNEYVENREKERKKLIEEHARAVIEYRQVRADLEAKAAADKQSTRK